MEVFIYFLIGTIVAIVYRLLFEQQPTSIFLLAIIIVTWPVFISLFILFCLFSLLSGEI